MGREYDGKVIRPPSEHVTSGKVFKPSNKFLFKQWTQMIITAMGILILVNLGMLGIGYLSMVISDGYSIVQYWAVISEIWVIINTIAVIILSIIFLPIAAVYPFYIRTFEYSVISKSGGVMPEIYVKKGLVSVTKKHVPFRTITNILSRAGPFDRLFGIGNIEIETAGSGRTTAAGQPAPDEKIEGIVFYEEVRDFILQELRKFRDPYVTGTEVVRQYEDPVPRHSDSLDDEILLTLREIRDLLKRERK